MIRIDKSTIYGEEIDYAKLVDALYDCVMALSLKGYDDTVKLITDHYKIPVTK
jgi:hypothetical protein